MSDDSSLTFSGVMRTVFAIATAVFAVGGFIVRDDARWFVAAGASGTLWLAVDLLRDYLARPLGDLARSALAEGGGLPAFGRPSTVDMTIALLERRLAAPGSRSSHLRAAVRLEELYRVMKHDPAQAHDVIRRARAKYPDAPELQSYETRESSD